MDGAGSRYSGHHQQQAGGHHSPEFFNSLQHVSPQMINMGLHAGQDMLNKQREMLMPGMNSFWNSLKEYFMVNNNYVKSKLLLVLYPIPQKSWTRRPIDDASAVYDETTSSYSHKWAPPKFDINAPDLYIPLMAFITYVLLVGYVKGTNNAFTPETLIRTVWSCLLLQLVEATIAKFGIHMMQVSIPFLDLFAYTGYKYVGLCVNTVILSLGKTLYFFCCVYTAGMLAYFVLKTTAGAIPAVSTQGPPRHLMILGFAAMQFVMISLLSWL